MFRSTTVPVQVDDATLHLPLTYRYVLVGKDGSVRAFRGRPELLDKQFNIWHHNSPLGSDLGILLGVFDGDFKPRLIKFAEKRGSIPHNSRGWVCDINV